MIADKDLIQLWRYFTLFAFPKYSSIGCLCVLKDLKVTSLKSELSPLWDVVENTANFFLFGFYVSDIDVLQN